MGFVRPLITDGNKKRRFRASSDTIANLKFAVVDSTPFSLTDEDILFVDTQAAGEDIVINFPASAERVSQTIISHAVTIKKIDETNDFDIIMIPDGSELLENENPLVIDKKLVSLTLAPDGSDYWII